MSLQPQKHPHGFTLVEVIIGIVVMAIALAFVVTVFFSNPSRTVEPILQMRAAEFAQALMDEIIAQRFDENTPLGGVPACTDPTDGADASDCVPAAGLGMDSGEFTVSGGVNVPIRNAFDDVDDYDGYCNDGPWPIEDLVAATPGDFANFAMTICVSYDTIPNAKLITVTVFTPSVRGSATPITFSAYRGNF